MKIVIKGRYNMVSTLDKKLRALEIQADKIKYDIDEDELYLKMCSILTDADFSNRKKIDSTFWWQLYRIVEYRLKGEN